MQVKQSSIRNLLRANGYDERYDRTPFWFWYLETDYRRKDEKTARRKGRVRTTTKAVPNEEKSSMNS